MSFLRRLFGSGDQAVQVTIVTFTGHRDDAVVDAVGESNYQDALLRHGSGRSVDGVRSTMHQALLMREPGNRYDRNAIAIYLRDPAGRADIVGYLSREDALRYQPVLSMLAPRTIGVEAMLTGGWDRGANDRGSIGVKLHLPTPGELGADLFIGERQLTREHRWAGRTVAFTGESRFRAGPIPLDREGQEYVARRAGCDTWPRVTKKVHVCVTADPNDLTGNLRKAEEYGLEIVREPDFWAGIGIPLERWQ